MTGGVIDAGVIEAGGPVTEDLRAGDPLQAGSPLRTPRAASVAGILFSVLLITALVLLRVSVPGRPQGRRRVAV